LFEDRHLARPAEERDPIGLPRRVHTGHAITRAARDLLATTGHDPSALYGTGVSGATSRSVLTHVCIVHISPCDLPRARPAWFTGWQLPAGRLSVGGGSSRAPRPLDISRQECSHGQASPAPHDRPPAAPTVFSLAPPS